MCTLDHVALRYNKGKYNAFVLMCIIIYSAIHIQEVMIEKMVPLSACISSTTIGVHEVWKVT